MWVFRGLLLSLSVLTTSLLALASQEGTKKYDYQSDVARLRKIVINSLYSHRDVFLRELISNANDALEKLRITSLTDKQVLEGAEQMNITIRAWKDEDGTSRLVIRDTGIGMNSDELTANLGTLAKSGTTEFLARAETDASTENTGNLIGAFGLGFYSSFLVADHVEVASIPAPSEKNPNPVQYIFSSSADDSTFEVSPDPRGNTLGRGTEITLYLKEDALDYMDTHKITNLVDKHSSFSTSFPIHLFTQRVEQVPIEEEETTPAESAESETETATASEVEDEATETPSEASEDEEAATVEDATNEEIEEEKEPETKSVIVDEWIHLNSQLPIWTRDPKTVSDEEYEAFYSATFKDYEKPLAWHHFSGDSGSGVSFKAIIFIPSKLSEDFWVTPLAGSAKDVRLMVKRVFITNDLGEDALPKWASWVKVVVDAEDLPLNVSREMLQSTKFLKQLRGIITKRILQMIQKLSGPEEEGGDGERWEQIQTAYNNVFKLGAVEDSKNRQKLATFVRFATNHGDFTTFDQYLEHRKQGQKQIFFLADAGKTTDELAKSIFVEKLHARGYEVLLFTEPLDEILVQNLKAWKKVKFQDVARAGLIFGDENEDPEEEKERQKVLTEEYKPLIDWLKKEAGDIVRDVVISNRLVTSPCAIVADTHGYTANVERMISAQNNRVDGFMHEYAKKMKLLEINPRSPLIEGLLRRISQLPTEEEERDIEAEDELREATSVLIDGALVRSGFGVPDSNKFFSRVDRILRRSLGVSEIAKADDTVKPAPPVADKPVEEEDFSFDDTHIRVEPDILDGIFTPHEEPQVKFEIEEIDDEDNPVKPITHDEL